MVWISHVDFAVMPFKTACMVVHGAWIVDDGFHSRSKAAFHPMRDTDSDNDSSLAGSSRQASWHRCEAMRGRS